MVSTTSRPQWLPGPALYPTTHRLIEQAYALASVEAIFPERKVAMLCKILVDLKADATLIAAALLVFAWRSGALEAETIAEKTAPEVLNLLRALDALGLIDHLHDQDKNDLEPLRKMLLAMASDMRAVILKLALQTVAMRCLSDYAPEDQQRLALQTRDLFAPLANRLGIAQLKWELEDRALQILEPDIYQELSQALEERRVDRERYIERIIALLSHALSQAGIEARKVYGRVKHINSIYQKMKRKKLKFSQVNDVRAVRVEVAGEEDCYRVLGIVHDMWEPIPAEFDDYISNPKANGYQSLHTSLIGPEGRVLEVQIRTTQMHESAELGVAAHWLYKEKGVRHSRQFEQQIDWLRRMLDGSGDAARGDVVFDQFKNEAFADRVYALSPQGQVVDLPEGSTPLDFAYHIHTSLGHRCKGAKINGKIVPLTTAIKNADTVEVLTQKEANPSRDWLNDHLGYLRSARAKAKVRSYFKKLEKEKSIEAGRDMLERECRRLNISISGDDLPEMARKFNVHSVADLHAGIGFGDIGVLTVAHELLERHTARQSSEQPSMEERLARLPIKQTRKTRRQNIDVGGVDDLLVNFATCCQPVPPAPISGFITAGRGVNIHRSNCANLQYLQSVHPERIVDVHWQDGDSSVYQVDIGIEAYDRTHILRDISQVLANEKVPILHVDMKQNERQQIEGVFSLEISDMSQLSRIIDRIAQIKDVANVGRIKR